MEVLEKYADRLTVGLTILSILLTAPLAMPSLTFSPIIHGPPLDPRVMSQLISTWPVS